ncbi:ArdC family protein [Candidatus Solirubrobacter pratensis]|uniref:ArdC family protein n=1 Tax=Candidatus Solirubrobacter pratensis TaxID=1298857 RepID=UPI000403234A|nr:zincin-like metallopeptidase domain-containing protein [Candidatus Solirubrobacter pratensis]
MAAKKTSRKSPRKRRSSAERFDVYVAVNEAMNKALDAGIKPWRKPWSSKPGQPIEQMRNAITGRAYRGINVFLLNVAAASMGYNDPRWLTFNQAAKRAKAVWLKANGHADDEAGETAYMEAVKAGYRGGVIKGEESTLVTLWKPFRADAKDPKTGEVILDPKTGKPKQVQRLLLTYFKVFNVEQCDNLDLASIVEEPEAEPEVEFTPIEAAESIVTEMPNAPSLRHGGNSAHYAPFLDHVQMPERGDFRTEESYYATLFHELVHSTGHESRLHRVKQWTGFGSGQPYAQEELVAEMGSAFLCGMANIDGDLDQSAAYLSGWAKAIKDETAKDRKWLVMAAARAQKAADYILGVQQNTQEPINGEAA